MNEKTNGLYYHCICIPNTGSLQVEVNKVLKEMNLILTILLMTN